MTELPILGILGGLGLTVLVVGWLVVSFARQPRTRGRAAASAATAMFLALASFFANLARSAWQEDGRIALVAFGFLLTLFTAGFFISLVKTASEFRRSREGVD